MEILGFPARHETRQDLGSARLSPPLLWLRMAGGRGIDSIFLVDWREDGRATMQSISGVVGRQA